MKQKQYFIFLFSTSHSFAQINLTIDVSQHYKITNPMYGFHTSDFFQHCVCYDPDLPPGGDIDIDLCMQYARDIQPQVLRMPSGGSSKLMHLLDDKGYGYREAEIESFHDDGYMSDDEYADYTGALILQNDLDPGVNYLERFIDLCLDQYAATGVKPKVIYVAKVLDSPYEAEDLTAYNLDILEKMIVDYGLEVVGVEMGNEVYGGGWELFPAFANANAYLSTILPLMVAIKSAYPTMKIGVVAAPEPEYYFSIEGDVDTYNKYKTWNNTLKTKCAVAPFNTIVDAFIIHLYMFDNAYPDCAFDTSGNLYDDYLAETPYNIDFESEDAYLGPPWQCARSAYNDFTLTKLTSIYNAYAGGYTYSLGIGKKYWVSEWGLQPSNPFGNSFIEASYVMQYLLNMAEISHNLSPATAGQVEYMIKHNYTAANPSAGVFSKHQDLDPSTSGAFLKRMNYYSFYMMRSIFRDRMEHAQETISYTGTGETPYIKTYMKKISNVGSTSNYDLYIFYNNQNADPITLNLPSITFKNGTATLPRAFPGSYFYNHIDARQIYQGIGETQYFKQNSWYDDYEDDIYPEFDDGTPGEWEINAIEVNSGLVTNISLEGYSYGYIYTRVQFPTWGGFRLMNENNTEEQVNENTDGNMYPNPASDHTTLYFSKTDVYAKYDCSIYNLHGQLMRQYEDINGDALQINKETFVSGIYLYKLFENGKEIGNGKFVFAE